MRNLIVTIMLLCPAIIYADHIEDGVSRYYGKVVFINKNKILLRQECTGKPVTYFWTDCTSIYFDTVCNHPDENKVANSGAIDTACPKKRVYVLKLLNKQVYSYADDLILKDGKLKIVYCHNKATVNLLAGNLEKYIEKISYVEMCVKDIPDNFPVF